MGIKTVLIGLTFPWLLATAAVAADFDKGEKAALVGDYATALAEWIPMAENGHVLAQCMLGTMYAHGLGMPKSNKIAVKWYTLAAEQGDADAQYNLGVLYSNGEGVWADNNVAIKWYTLAAEQGFDKAQYNLALLYANGEGVPKDDQVVEMWYTLAAKQGKAEAQSNLGVMYEFGVNVTVDHLQAYMWYNIAAFNGNMLGAKNKENIVENMTFAQINEAQEMSSRCLESGYKDC